MRGKKRGEGNKKSRALLLSPRGESKRARLRDGAGGRAQPEAEEERGVLAQGGARGKAERSNSLPYRNAQRPATESLPFRVTRPPLSPSKPEKDDGEKWNQASFFFHFFVLPTMASRLLLLAASSRRGASSRVAQSLLLSSSRSLWALQEVPSSLLRWHLASSQFLLIDLHLHQ